MPSRPPRVLLVLPQLPQDPAAGAARSLTIISEMLAAAGFAVRALAVTTSQGAGHLDTPAYLNSLGINPKVEKHVQRRELRFSQRGIEFRLLDVGELSLTDWEAVLGRQFDRLFDDELRAFRPQIVFTYGGSEGERRRRVRARRQGAKLVFGLRNEAYLTPHSLDDVDAVLTPSQYLSDLYRNALGVDSTPLPPPILPEEVQCQEHDPIFITMINPSPDKGVTVLARLAEVLSVERPDLPILVIESRGTAGLLASVALLGGFDLRRHENIMVSPPVPLPRDIYTPTRVLIVPSLLESAGRVVEEALLNGIPPVVSDRGGLPEMCAGAGFVVPLPKTLQVADRMPVAAEVVRPWVDTIVRLCDDDQFYQAACRKARAAGDLYRPEHLAPRYVEFFRRVLAG